MENTTTSFADAASAARIAEMTAPIPKKKGFSRAKLQENIWGWIFVAAILIGTTVFVYISFILSVWMSFTSYESMVMKPFWEVLGTMHYEGWYHWYQVMFTPGTSAVTGEATYVWNTLGTTVFYLIGIPIGMALSLGISVLLTRDIKFTGTFRVIYYIPTVASVVSISIMWTNLFGSGGFMEELFGLSMLSGEGSSIWTQRWCLIILTVWKGLGGTVVLFVAGLNGVNASYKEAAEIDGANAWQIFWRITMPQLYPTIFYVLVTSVIGGMQIYVEPNLVFGSWDLGGTQFNTPYVGYIYKVFEDGEWAHASALGIVLAIIIFILTLIQFALDAKKEKD